MKNKYCVILISLFAIAMYGCKKVDYGSPEIKNATLTITAPVNFSLAGPVAVCNTALDVSNENFTYGFCYSLTRNPVIPGLATAASNFASGSFSALLPNLQYGKTYYIKAFVTNGLVTTYSNLDSFLIPNYLSSGDVKNITARTFDIAVTTQSILADPIDSFGVCYGTTTKPTVNNQKQFIAAPANGTFNLHVSDSLKNGTTYYLRSFVYTAGQAFYGNETSFKTAGYKGSSGGYVFFDKGDSTGGWRYLEAVPDTVIIANAPWGCAGASIPGIVSGMGTGYENSNSIITGCAETGIAARLCRELVFKTNSDWYLPTIDELVALYQLKVSKIITRTDVFYSSMQASATDCIVFDFSTGQQAQESKSATNALTWAVRRF